MKTAQEFANDLFQLKNWTNYTVQELASFGRIVPENAKNIAKENSALWFDASDINGSLDRTEEITKLLEEMIRAENLK